MQSVGLHLLPGLVFLLFYSLITPLLVDRGYPSFLGLFVTAGLVEIPMLLGFMLYKGREENGRYTLKNIIGYRESIPAWQYITYGLPLVLWAFVVSSIFNLLLDNIILQNLFAWLPDWFVFNNFAENFEQYSQGVLTTTFVTAIIVGGFGASVVQEIYFRGYLLPRISQYGNWAPVINAFLFAVYHFISPWRIVSITFALLPLSYVVQKKRNIYIGVAVHFLFGTLPLLAFLALIQ